MSETAAEQLPSVIEDRVIHDPENNRYVLMRGEQELGVEEYDIRHGVIRFLHTIVPDIGERGLGAKLVEGALADVRARAENKLLPVCPYVKHYLTKHPEWHDLLVEPLEG